MEKKKGLSLQTILTIAGIALIYVLAFLLDRIPGVPIMLTTVLRKGAIYSLVAVSMNLLNGFTGLFSLPGGLHAGRRLCLRRHQHLERHPLDGVSVL